MAQILKWLEDAALWIAGLALLMMGFIVSASVLGRTIFNAPVPDDLIMVGLLMVCVIVLPLAFIERNDGHIVVTILADRLPSRLQGLLRAFGNIVLMVFFGTMGFLLAKKVPGEFSEGLYYDGQLDIPTWPMKAMFAAGVAVLVLRLLISLVSNIRAALGIPDNASGAQNMKE